MLEDMAARKLNPLQPIWMANGFLRCTWTRLPLIICEATIGPVGALSAYLDPDCPDALPAQVD
jgi:hypothetical protein